MDYIRISYLFSASDAGSSYLSKAYTAQLQAFRVNRYNANNKQKTFSTTVKEVWTNLKDAIKIVTEKTVI
jgi:hypothetical protein